MNKSRKFYYDCTICGKRHEIFLNWPVETIGKRLSKKMWQRLKFECMAELYNCHRKLHPIDPFPYHKVKIKRIK